ncbi:MAG: hypothetical protein AABX54_03190 [Nanoarchaeota archaeon]|mgnify:FL=1
MAKKKRDISKKIHLRKIHPAKEGAIEMSMSTIVVLVLAMSMLILGLVLVRSIFRTATNSVNELDNKVRTEITNLFVDESNKVVVKLGSDYTARITAGTTNFGIGIGAKTLSGSPATKELKYKLTVDDTARENCYKILGRNGVKVLFKQNLDTYSEFDRFEGDAAFAIIQVDVPEGTALCSQKIFVDVKDGDQTVGRTVFIVDIVRKGFFG